jgi:hypothetical protein
MRARRIPVVLVAESQCLDRVHPTSVFGGCSNACAFDLCSRVNPRLTGYTIVGHAPKTGFDRAELLAGSRLVVTRRFHQEVLLALSVTATARKCHRRRHLACHRVITQRQTKRRRSRNSRCGTCSIATSRDVTNSALGVNQARCSSAASTAASGRQAGHSTKSLNASRRR